MSNLCTASEALLEVQSRAWEHVNRLAPEDQHAIHACISAILSSVAVAREHAEIHSDPVLAALKVLERDIDTAVGRLHECLPRVSESAAPAPEDRPLTPVPDVFLREMPS